MAAFTFKKYIGEYPNDNALKDALETGTLNTPFLVLVDGDLNYDSIVYIDMYVDDELECTLQKNPSANTWTAYSISVAMDSTIKFRSNGNDLTFIVDGNDYTEWIAETNLSNPILTLANGEFTLTYTDDGSYDVRVYVDSTAYELTYGQTTTVNQDLGSTIENGDYNSTNWYWNGTFVMESPHLDKEDIPGYTMGVTIHIDSLRAEQGTVPEVYVVGTVTTNSGGDEGGGDDPGYIF